MIRTALMCEKLSGYTIILCSNRDASRAKRWSTSLEENRPQITQIFAELIPPASPPVRRFSVRAFSDFVIFPNACSVRAAGKQRVSSLAALGFTVEASVSQSRALDEDQSVVLECKD